MWKMISTTKLSKKYQFSNKKGHFFSSNINEVIRPVLNFLFFFYKKISPVQKSTKHKKCV